MAASNERISAAKRKLVIARVFDAPRRLVFEVWTKPEHLVHWWGPKGFTLPSCQMDFRPGVLLRCLKSYRETNGSPSRPNICFDFWTSAYQAIDG